MNVMQIAHILGFTDSYYFSRMFSRIMKNPPPDLMVYSQNLSVPDFVR